MKRYFLALMALIAAVSLIACSTSGSGDDENDDDPVGNDPNDGVYTVVYHKGDADSGTVPVDKHEYSSGDTLTIRYNSGNLVREGYTFAGWMSYSYSYSFESGSYHSIYDDMDFYPRWNEVQVTTYSVTYTYTDTGDISGSLPHDNTEYKSGDTVPVLGNTGNLARTGYTFAGWRDATAAQDYVAGNTFTINSDVTLTARWSVTGGGTGGGTGGTPTHTNDDTLEAFKALGQGLVAAVTESDTSASAYTVKTYGTTQNKVVYHLNGYTYNGITLNGTLTYTTTKATTTTSTKLDQVGTITVTGNDVSKIIYNIHTVGTTMSGSYGYEFTDGSKWTHNLSDNTFTQD